VLNIWTRGQVVDVEGRPWGDTPDVKPELLAATPAMSIGAASVADWMVASSMIAELKDQSMIRDLLGQDDYLGQDAFGPEGRTVDHARGLTCAWDVKKMMKELLGCSSVDRDMSYWMFNDGPLDKMIKYTASGEIERGEIVCICLITNWLWVEATKGNAIADMEGTARPEHWVRLRSVEDVGGGILTVKVFSFGEVQEATLSRAGFGRIVFESLFGKLL